MAARTVIHCCWLDPLALERWWYSLHGILNLGSMHFGAEVCVPDSSTVNCCLMLVTHIEMSLPMQSHAERSGYADR